MLRRGRLVVLAVAGGAAPPLSPPPRPAGTPKNGLARGQLAQNLPPPPAPPAPARPPPPAAPPPPPPPAPQAAAPTADPPPPAAPALPTAAWEEAHASKAPASRARVRGPELGAPGVLTFTGGEIQATADGGVTSSTVTLGRLVLGGASGAPEVGPSNLCGRAPQAMGKPGTAPSATAPARLPRQSLRPP